MILSSTGYSHAYRKTTRIYMHKIFRLLLTVSTFMLAVGVTLPLPLTYFVPDVSVPVLVWDVLQIGGLAGSVIFFILEKITKPRTSEEKSG